MRAERTIQTVRRQHITLKLALEAQYTIKLSDAMSVWSWILRHSAWLIERFGVKVRENTLYGARRVQLQVRDCPLGKLCCGGCHSQTQGVQFKANDNDEVSQLGRKACGLAGQKKAMII